MPSLFITMQEIILTLTDEEFKVLNDSNNYSSKSADIGLRAIEVVRIYARRQQWSENEFTRKGVDLSFNSVSGNTVEIEVKGTQSSGMQWNKLKVSGNPCYDNLKNNMPLYRVSSVFDQNPTIYILKFGEDFTMEMEPRWKIKKT